MPRFPYSLDGKKCPPPGPGAGSLWPVGEVFWWSGLPTGHPGSLCSYLTRYAEILPPILLSGIRCRFAYSSLCRRLSICSESRPENAERDGRCPRTLLRTLSKKTWTVSAVYKQRREQCWLSANKDVINVSCQQTMMLKVSAVSK